MPQSGRLLLSRAAAPCALLALLADIAGSERALGDAGLATQTHCAVRRLDAAFRARLLAGCSPLWRAIGPAVVSFPSLCAPRRCARCAHAHASAGVPVARRLNAMR